MRTVTMAEAAGTAKSPSQMAVNTRYLTSMEITTRRGGIFWGLLLLIVGVVWLAGSLGYVTLNFDILLPLLVIVAGLYLLVTKLIR